MKKKAAALMNEKRGLTQQPEQYAHAEQKRENIVAQLSRQKSKIFIMN